MSQRESKGKRVNEAGGGRDREACTHNVGNVDIFSASDLISGECSVAENMRVCSLLSPTCPTHTLISSRPSLQIASLTDLALPKR